MQFFISDNCSIVLPGKDVVKGNSMIIGRFRSVLLVLCLLSPAIAASGSDLMPARLWFS